MGVIIPQVVTESRASGAQVVEGSTRFDSANEDYLTKFKADIIVNNNKIKDLILSSQFSTKEDLKLSIIITPTPVWLPLEDFSINGNLKLFSFITLSESSE